ncbi:hypothetical protein C5167_033853 [Papaver somniferum]|uniref:Uncharacterized protein n=1 Tax=Papaver somniferum TaxID=3469 RepID=A0A4Y7KFA2_PAPSO|nr:hypothetical protein C5167_033853 [Papaver somniferum]
MFVVNLSGDQFRNGIRRSLRKNAAIKWKANVAPLEVPSSPSIPEHIAHFVDL